MRRRCGHATAQPCEWDDESQLQRHSHVIGGLYGRKIESKDESHGGAKQGGHADDGDAADRESESQRKGETARRDALAQPFAGFDLDSFSNWRLHIQLDPNAAF